MDDGAKRTASSVGGAVLVAGLVGVLAERISRDESHLGRALLAAAAVALLGARGLVPDRFRHVYLGTLALAATLSVFNYWQFDAKLFGGINDYTDTAYYYTNSKYLAELEYDGLYAGALLCDAERGSPRTKHIRTIRDLRDDELSTFAEELVHGREVKAAFTPERWAAFCADMRFFLDRIDRSLLEDNFFVDHGYNPPPTWTLVGGNLSRLVSVEQLKWICHVDTVLVAVMFVAVGWAFGLEAMLWAVLFYMVTFSGRWPILGMAITRFDWVVALVIGLCLLKRSLYGGAGAAMTYAALNRVFPAIFLWGWFVEAARDTIRERRILPKHARFAAMAVLTATLMTGLAAVQYGPDTLAQSAHHLRLHNESFSSHRVGLAGVLVYRGETTRDELRAIGGVRTKELAVQAMMPALRVVAVGLLAFVAFVGWRTRWPAWELVALTALPLYVATTPQVNYLNYRLVLLAWHAAYLDRPIHRGLLALLFAVEIAAQVAHVRDIDRYTVNAVSSIGLLVYYLVLVGYLLASLRSPAKEYAPAA